MRIYPESWYRRVLRAPRYFDWATAFEIHQALECDDKCGHAWRTALSWHVRHGNVIASGKHGSKRYRLAS